MGAVNEVAWHNTRMSDLETHRRADTNSHRAALIGLAVCLLLVLAGLGLVYAMKRMSDLQDCVMQGRTNCAPIDSNQTAN
jgi:hypothetical protein